MTNLVQFHTFQNTKDKQLSVVINNVPISLTENKVKEELVSNNLTIKRITRLVNKDKRPISICAVILIENDTTKKFLN